MFAQITCSQKIYRFKETKWNTDLVEIQVDFPAASVPIGKWRTKTELTELIVYNELRNTYIERSPQKLQFIKRRQG